MADTVNTTTQVVETENVESTDGIPNDPPPPVPPSDENQSKIKQIKSSTDDLKAKYDQMKVEKHVNLDDTLGVLTEMFVALEKYALLHVQELEKQQNLLDIFDIIDNDFKEMLNLIKPLNTTQLNSLREELSKKSTDSGFDKNELLPKLKATIEKVKDLEEANKASAAADAAAAAAGATGGKRKKKCNKTKRRRRKK